MAQVINPLSIPATVEGYVRGFIYTDADGSQRVNVAGLQAFLTEQFGYLTGTDSHFTYMDRSAAGDGIARRLQEVVGREHWYANSDYPNPGLNTGDAVKSRLLEVRSELLAEVKALGDSYSNVLAGLTARAKAIFYELASGSFPAGVKLLETTRVYVETFVTDRGEESRPSAPSVLTTLDQNDTATVTCSAPPSGRNVTARRLYRSATGTALSAFKLQGEYAIATTAITDATLDEQLNDVCPTFGWLEPPATLAGLTGMPNGIMLGFVGRTLYACEPFEPYAWPAKYDKPLAHQITGIVVAGQSAFIGTTGRPYLVTGADSASLTEEIISSRVPCLSAASMVAIENSVFYASPDGLALYENGRVIIITKGILSRKAWRAYNPASMRAAEFDGMYFAFFTRADTTRGALVFDYEKKTFSELDQGADAVFATDAGLYLLDGTTIYDAIPASAANRTGSWFSKTFRLARPQAFGWIMVDSDFLNNGSPVSATVRVYAGGVLHHTATIANGTPVRNKPGKHADWRVEIECAATIDGCVLASTTEELKAAV